MLVSPSSVALRAAAAAATAAARPVAARSLSTHVDRSARVSPAYNAGRGGYSSNKGVVATVFGATGFLGRYVVDALASTGITCIIPYRGSDMEPRHLKLMGDLGRVNPIPFDPRVVDSVREVVRPAQLVVNLIGKDFETKHALGSLVKNYTYEQVHAEVPRMLAQVCAEQNVHQLIHVSSLAARPGALSKLDESKLLGEIAVKTNFPAATIIKPANMFGDEDRFLNKIAKMARGLPRIAMVNNGAQRLQPVSVNDVAAAIRTLVQKNESLGATYNLAGPRVWTRKEVTEFVCHVTGREVAAVDLPTGLLKAFGFAAEQFANPWFTMDEVVSMLQDNVIEEGQTNHLPLLLGREPVDMEHASYRQLHGFLQGGHFSV